MILGTAFVTFACTALTFYNLGRRDERRAVEERMRAYQRKLRQMERR